MPVRRVARTVVDHRKRREPARFLLGIVTQSVPAGEGVLMRLAPRVQADNGAGRWPIGTNSAAVLGAPSAGLGVLAEVRDAAAERTFRGKA